MGSILFEIFFSIFRRYITNIMHFNIEFFKIF